MTFRKQFRIRHAKLTNVAIDKNAEYKQRVEYKQYNRRNTKSATSLLTMSVDEIDNSIEYADDRNRQEMQRRLAARDAREAEAEGRIHTRGHKHISYVFSRDNDTYCKQHNTFTRHRHETMCHDRKEDM